MDKLENIIIENRESFNSRKMPKGHAARFEQRLGKKQGIFISTRHLWVAASIAILIGCGITFLNVQKPNAGGAELCEYSDELCEMQVYFASSLQHSRSLLEVYKQQGIANQDEMNLFEEEMQELETIQAQIAQDFKLAPDDEMVLNALIEVYRQKQELINTILFQLNQAKEQKYKQDALANAVEL